MIVEEGIIEVDLAIEGNELKVLQHAHKLIRGRNFNGKMANSSYDLFYFLHFHTLLFKNQTHTLIIGHTSKQEVSVPFLLASQKFLFLWHKFIKCWLLHHLNEHLSWMMTVYSMSFLDLKYFLKYKTCHVASPKRQHIEKTEKYSTLEFVDSLVSRI